MYHRIGFGKRAAAWLIDMVVVLVGGFLIGPIVGGLFGLTTGAAVGGVAGGPGGAAVGGLMGAVLGAVAGLGVGASLMGILFGVWEALTGAALGKLLLGIRIKSDSGAPAPPERLVARAALKHSGELIGFLASVSGSAALANLGYLAGVVIFVGCFLVLGQSRQAIHDRIARTAVYLD